MTLQLLVYVAMPTKSVIPTLGMISKPPAVYFISVCELSVWGEM